MEYLLWSLPVVLAAALVGSGQVTTVPAPTGLGLGPMQVVLFGLFSQTMVPWGALANRTVVGAQLAGLVPQDLGVHNALLTAPLLLCWLLLFWRMARRAGIGARDLACFAEALWLATAALLLVAANAALGPEVAALAALGPLVAARFVLRERPDAARWRAAARVGLPFAALILGLAGTRAISAVSIALGEVAWQPVPGGAVLHLFLHPAAWLLATGTTPALLLGRGRRLGPAVAAAWSRGCRPCAAILCFLVMAQLMSESGMAAGLATGLRLLLDAAAPVATPVLAGLFGFLTSSGNASNGLLMPSQVALATETGVSLPWLAAIQNTAGSAMTMLSPVRLAMGCALVGRPDLERPAYAHAWPLAASAMLVLVGVACLLVFAGGRN